MGVTVPHRIQPIPGLVFTETWMAQQLINKPLVSIRAAISQERGQRLRIWWQSRQHQGRPPRQRSAIGFGSKLQFFGS